MSYLDRVVDAELADRLRTAGAVVMEGAKASGKTMTASRAAASSVFVDTDAAARQAIAVDPGLVLEGARPRLLDEWQSEPSLWNHVRRSVDAAGQPGQFILTGSATPADDASRHTGAGRFSFLRMRPMTLSETGHSTGQVSLAELFAGAEPRASAADLTVRDLADRLTVGGWPAYQQMSVASAGRANRDYLQQVRQVDVSQVGERRRDPQKVGALLHSLARNVATEARTSVLAADAGGADGPLSDHTVADYLDALARLMITEDQPAWSPHLRSKATLRKAPKRHLVDPSLAVAALGAGPEALMGDLSLLGNLFESLVVRELRVLAQPLEGTVFHYRDSYGLEVDAVVQLADRRWAAFEVKLGEGMVSDGAESLLRFARSVDTGRMGPPTLLAVICGTGYAYRRPDGVCVIPVGTLGP